MGPKSLLVPHERGKMRRRVGRPSAQDLMGAAKQALESKPKTPAPHPFLSSLIRLQT